MSKKIRIAAAMLIAAAVAFAAYGLHRSYSGSKEAAAVLDQMYYIVPGLGEDSGTSAGTGRAEPAAVSIDGTDIVGCLEIPSLDIMVPVTAGESKAGFASYVSGSPVTGSLRLRGGRRDIFRNLADLRPGDRASFTDMDGVRYTYEVTTQYHLKEWDEGSNDLMIGCSTDEHTDFIVGCSSY